MSILYWSKYRIIENPLLILFSLFAKFYMIISLKNGSYTLKQSTVAENCVIVTHHIKISILKISNLKTVSNHHKFDMFEVSVIFWSVNVHVRLQVRGTIHTAFNNSALSLSRSRGEAGVWGLKPINFLTCQGSNYPKSTSVSYHWW